MTPSARRSPRSALLAAHITPVVLAVAAVLAAPVATAKPPDGVPFKADVAVRETLLVSDTSSCPALVGKTTGQGHASHLGAVRLVAGDCVVPTPDGGFAFFNGAFTFIAANGDKLTGTYATSGLVALLPTARPDVVMLSTPYVITGGTGRFSHATGEGTLSGTLRLGPSTGAAGVVGIAEGSYQADGRISY